MIRTHEFAIAPSAIAATLARQWLGRRWFFFVLPLLAALVAGVYDIRMFIVALILLLIVWPMALSFVWFGHALEPDAVRASLPHVLEFDRLGFRVVYSASDQHTAPPPERFMWTDITTAIHDRGYVVYSCSSGKHVAAPVSSFDADVWRIIDGWRIDVGAS